MKEPYLVVYDYGMGGLWAVIHARSKGEILSKFVDIEILDTRPFSMSEDEYQRIISTSSFDIDDDPSGWLARLRKSSG